MEFVKSFALFLSGGLVVSSIMIAKIGRDRSVLSRRAASLIAAIGVGFGGFLFIYFGISNGDLIGSLITGLIIGATAGVVVLIPNRWWP